MPRTLGSFACGSRPQAASASAAMTKAAALLERILDILRDVHAPVNDIRTIDDQDQRLLLRDLRDCAACLIDQRFERLVLLVAHHFLVPLKNLLLLLRIVLGALHVFDR